MPSTALTVWTNDRLPALAEVDAQCVACQAAIPPNPRLLDEDIRSYIMLLAAHFQGFCRDLYTESSQAFTNAAAARLQTVIAIQFSEGCQLNSKNANFQSVSSDFSRFNPLFDLASDDPANPARITKLGDLNRWRNIAAHYKQLPTTGLPGLPEIRTWRNSCDGLATSLNRIMYNTLNTTLAAPPWAP